MKRKIVSGNIDLPRLVWVVVFISVLGTVTEEATVVQELVTELK